mmetsp:Transcript_28709/g.60943  ORF Transcript_28709/g.60943 Transcript_28709/m.60943 type:complete len:825 (-) Transcript_28709:71-2545(-)
MAATELASSQALEHSKSWYRPDIDGLRAVAVVAVITYHMNNLWLPGGFAGVDIFFVISGYVVASSALRHSSASTLDHFADFYARRAKRIAPAVIVSTCIVGVLMALIIPPYTPHFRRNYLIGMFGLVGMSNNPLATLEVGYMDDPADEQLNPFLHTWSLGVEEQYYLLFPMVMLAAYGAPSSEPDACCTRTKSGTSSHLRSAAVWLTGIVLSAALSAVLTFQNKQVAFYILPCRYWELALGAFVFDTQATWSVLVEHAIVRLIMQLLAVLCICAGFVFIPGSSGFPFPWALVPVVGAMSCIVSGASPHSYLNALLGRQWPVYVGKVSYSLYLWHWPVLAISTWFADRGSVAYYVTSAGVFSVVAVVTYNVVERPFLTWHPNRRYLVFVALFVAVSVSESLLALLRGPLCGTLYGGGVVFVVKDSNDSAVVFNTVNTTLHAGDSVCRCKTDPAVLHTPPQAQTATSNLELPSCLSKDNIEPRYASEGQQCFEGGAGNTKHDPPATIAKRASACLARPVDTPVIYLIGDSKAAMLLRGMTQAAAGRYVVKTYTCAQFGYMPHSLNPPKWCDRYSITVRTILQERLRRGDIVAVANHRNRFRNPALRPAVLNTLEDLGAVAAKKGASVLLLGDSATIAGTGWKCVPTFFNPDADKACAISRSKADAILHQYHQALEILSWRHENMHFFDYHHLFCSSRTCGAFIPNTRVLGLWDNNHLTTAGSSYLWTYLCSALTDIARGRLSAGFLQNHTLHLGSAKHRDPVESSRMHPVQHPGPVNPRGLAYLVHAAPQDGAGQDQGAAVSLHLRGHRGHRGAAGVPWHHQLGER